MVSSGACMGLCGAVKGNVEQERFFWVAIVNKAYGLACLNVGQVLAREFYRLPVFLEIVAAFTLMFVVVRIRMEVTMKLIEAMSVRELMGLRMAQVPLSHDAGLVAVLAECISNRVGVWRKPHVVPRVDLVVRDPEL